MRETAEPNVLIELERPGLVQYVNLLANDRWQVLGECNRCGLCAIGAARPDKYRWAGPPGTPGACDDLDYGFRADEPCHPSMGPAMAAMARQTPGATVTGCSFIFVPLG